MLVNAAGWNALNYIALPLLVTARASLAWLVRQKMIPPSPLGEGRGEGQFFRFRDGLRFFVRSAAAKPNRAHAAIAAGLSSASGGAWR